MKKSLLNSQFSVANCQLCMCVFLFERFWRFCLIVVEYFVCPSTFNTDQEIFSPNRNSHVCKLLCYLFNLSILTSFPVTRKFARLNDYTVPIGRSYNYPYSIYLRFSTIIVCYASQALS